MSALPDYAEALRAALGATPPLGRAETLPLDRCSGRVLAEPVRADRELPPFDRAEMDGYALRAAEFAPDRAWRVVGTIAAGAAPALDVPAGCCVAIATGAALPPGLDAVIQHELSDRSDPVRFSVAAVAPGRSVHRRAADARRDEVVLGPGTLLAAHHLAIAASVGCGTLAVRPRPRAIVLTSGDEVVDVAAAPAPHQIRNSNAPLVLDLLRRMGAEPLRHEHVPDERPATERALRAALGEADLVVTIGGVSAGERDHFPTAMDACGVSRAVHGAAIQPGRPVLVGRAGATMVVGLPGNPVSVLACACLFLWPVLGRLLGLAGDLPWRATALASEVRPNPKRRAFRPHADGSASVPRWSGSGDLTHTAPTHGLVELPLQDANVPPGTTLRFLSFP
jgi:molybdopterin molybdotransferase